MGRTWDENTYIEWGYRLVNLTGKGDFKSPSWYKNEATNGPPLALYFYGAASKLDVGKFDSAGNPVFNYDFTHARIVSVLLSSLTAVLITVLGWSYISSFVGIVSGAVFSLLPISLGYSQLATLESFILFFFTATILSFLNYLSNHSKKNIILTGAFLGLALLVKYTNFLLIPLMIWIFFIWHFKDKKQRIPLKNYVKTFLIIFAVAFLVVLFLWPMPWFHLKEVFAHNIGLRYSRYSIPEVFFGKLMLVPNIYYLVYFLITTPLLILLFFLIGLLGINRQKSWILFSLVVWFVLPFAQSFYNFRQHGIRYIIEIYPPLALICGIGIGYISGKLRKTWLKILFLAGTAFYLFFILYKISPYYLDYFNEVAGGTKNVYEKRLFQLGWWGQGVRQAANYVERNARLKSAVGIALSPAQVMPSLPEMSVTIYDQRKEYDYVIVNLYNILREGFDDRMIKKNYKLAYQVKADGATLVFVYKHL